MRGVGKTVGKVLDNPITPIVASSLLGQAVRGRGKLFLDPKSMRSRVMRYAKELERNGMSKSESMK